MRPDWLAPQVQPFFFESNSKTRRGWDERLTAELSDTYRAWKLERLSIRWLSEREFFSLPSAERARLVRAQVALGRGAVPTVRRWADLLDASLLHAQADGRRFVFWPSLVDDRVLARVCTRSPSGAERPFPPSRHEEVAVWPAVVPGARAMAGTFAGGSGPNCFSTVLDAAGAGDIGFERWVADACRRGGDDNESGTVLVWRDTSGAPAHAAITLGDGWAFEKPSREWWTPRHVLRVEELKRGNRVRGWRLERHRIVRPYRADSVAIGR